MIGDRKTNIFGKLVRQKVVFFEEVGPARSGGSTKSASFVRHAAVQDAGGARGKRRARRRNSKTQNPHILAVSMQGALSGKK